MAKIGPKRLGFNRNRGQGRFLIQVAAKMSFGIRIAKGGSRSTKHFPVFEEEPLMLVLTRKLGEAIRIGSEVEIYVIGVSRGKVRLGLRAPKSIVVQRMEIAERTAAIPPTVDALPPVVARLNRYDMASEPPLRVFRHASGIADRMAAGSGR
jgi:carbon storage regulator